MSGWVGWLRSAGRRIGSSLAVLAVLAVAATVLFAGGAGLLVLGAIILSIFIIFFLIVLFAVTGPAVLPRMLPEPQGDLRLRHGHDECLIPLLSPGRRTPPNTPSSDGSLAATSSWRGHLTQGRCGTFRSPAGPGSYALRRWRSPGSGAASAVVVTVGKAKVTCVLNARSQISLDGKPLLQASADGVQCSYYDHIEQPPRAP